MTTTTNLALNQPAYNSSAWDVPLNANEDILDAAFGGTTSVALTNSNVTLTSTQLQAMQLRFTGAISANITIYVPSGYYGRWTVTNATSGAYTLTIASAAGGTTINVPQGYSSLVCCDSTGVFLSDNGLTTGTITLSTLNVGTIVGTGGTLTITGNVTPSGRITPRVSVTNAPSSPFAWNSNSYDEIVLTGIAGSLTINADSGSPVQGQMIIFRLKDSGTSQTLTWTQSGTASFRQIGVFLPTATTASKTTYVGAIYNSTDGYWDVVAVTTQT